MIVKCETCLREFEDVYRSYVCPHDPFPANDGNNNFEMHHDAYLSGEQKCEWPGCESAALCSSGNFDGKLVCTAHFKVTNG